ncbi:UDP-N-acetylmuramoylalanyl-D-glutamyl-2, 6-diaminopimelate--D-alanyl-D-alanine ligase [Tardibacter chloracetimidivorans]|uniref:UDP-N-acetylmuramoyl-tripeptide--D-alanyl-D-alanine ligase n=1 Tax=Tardibacter chloracetimidivorans TaxID=1921510 RepID=A0A1L3ZUK2_9SPHN|nr:UDP-N-acetylmuramoyl-tripeptide--D-alanyl-D-alanine ligase [Tardibacter chloracetimidivorans]API59297.1 UDP-N-acetylmuramoylalanyl-D-glutamyl-2, 6-diaminopimelate--D-alanyl-D-alanine ligase [Tardibacter chloracetimidivorans]
MNALWTSDEIATATGGMAGAAFSASGVAFDSREIEPGHLFVALKGESTDGHLFVEQAFARGASGALVSQPAQHPHVLVPDTMRGLEALGIASRARATGRIAGITGSVGKTGTKEALRLALERSAPGRVHASVKSYNNHTGVPLSLARMPADSCYGVFEMGMNHAGELAALTRLVRPHVAVVTWIASAHREFFASEEAIADAKGEIFEGLEPGGTAIIPFDSPHRDRLIGHARPHAGKIVTFGSGEGADVRASHVGTGREGGSLISAELGGRTLTFSVGMAGAHWVNNALAVIAAVDALGGDLAAAGLALADLKGLPGRGARRRISIGGEAALLIDESYNANPASMAAALRVLGETPATGRKIAVLGAMRELGPGSDEYHAGLADAVLASGAAHALVVGPEMAALASALGSGIDVRHLADAAAAEQALRDLIGAGDVVLVKGSNSVGLGRLVASLSDDGVES